MRKRRSREAPYPARWRGAAWLRAVLLIAGAVLLLAGCLPPQAHFDLGVGTSYIRGYLRADPKQPTPGGTLIVVYQYHHQFVNNPDGSPVLMPTARVLQPGPYGEFVIDVPTDVVRMDILFIAPEHLTKLFHFRRQLGVGDIDYRATLPAMPDWRSHYYTYLSPQLQNLILEPRYRLAPAEQQLLGQWLQAQNDRLGAGSGHS